MGIRVLPPDVNESEGMFTPVGVDIRYGLGAIRNVGNNVVAGIVAARDGQGKSRRFNDFLERVPAVVCNKRIIEGLIKAGAFDSLGHTRQGLMDSSRPTSIPFIDPKRNEANGQVDLFADFGADTGGDGGAGRVPSAARARVGQEGAAALRARDARAVRVRPSAVQARARARRPRRHPDRGPDAA